MKVPFNTRPLNLETYADSYRTGDYLYTYEVLPGGGAGWIVWRNDGKVLGDFGSRSAAEQSIAGFQHQDYLLSIQQWNHARAHGMDTAAGVASTPLCMKETPDATG
jgi:hypothetical protein